MKRVIIALLLCFIFSSEIQAKKVEIGSTFSGAGFEWDLEGGECEYQILDWYVAYAHAHKSNELVLKALVGEEETERETTVWDLEGFFPETTTGPKAALAKDSSKWKADRGESWSLVWVLQSTKGKGRVIDAVDVESGICPP